MSSVVLFFIAGLVLGVLVTSIYFERRIKNRGESDLTIEAIIHELRTPLTGISWIFNSLAEIKLNEPLNEEALSLVKEGHNKINNALGLANDALTALNTSVEHAKYEMEMNSLVEVVNKVIEENSISAKERSVTINFESPEDAIPFPFDKIKITLAVRNLISNAVKYTPVGGRVDVEVRRDGNRMVLVVADTGMGIPEADMAKMFGKFFRARNVGDVSGSGLGLFIVNNIVAGHHGKIDIQSTEGKGTKVTVSLPIN